MKKILFSVVSLGLLVTSCDMDLNEPGTITDTESIKTLSDCAAYRNNLYNALRGITSGAYIYYSELEMDQFLGMYGNDNRGMYFSTANITSSYSDLNSIYNNVYSSMKNVNFLLQHGQSIYDSGNLSADDAKELARYLAEAKFVRGYMYFYLFDHYCQAYDESKGDQAGLGLQLVTFYDPTGDTSKYPGRSSQNATLKLINDDLKDAFDGLVEYEKSNTDYCKPNASYLSSYAVAALQARVALVTGQYKTAYEKAEYVMGNTNYALESGENYIDMWYNDFGSELIFVPFVDAQESAYVSSFNDGWNYYSNFPQRIDYAPTASVLNSYESGDIRHESFFYLGEGLDFGDMGKADVYVFNKFPGNDALITGTNYYKNKPKPFRLSEQYLIYAEAKNALGADGDACDALSKLRTARGLEDTDMTLKGNALRDVIRQERAKELIGEGFRMSDLRRWKLGFTRDSSYPSNPEVSDFFIPSTVSVSFTVDDYRYVWPIPYDEMQVNPQLAGQQNPGYGN